jgi:hypothetical protein
VDKCLDEEPPLMLVAERHFSACWEWQNVTQEKEKEHIANAVAVEGV